MNESQRITNTVRTKDPRRVEAGKRLAAISRQAKERKASERACTGMETAEAVSDTTDRIGIVLGIAGLAVGVAGIYYASKNIPSKLSKPKEEHTEQTPQKTDNPQTPVLDSLD